MYKGVTDFEPLGTVYSQKMSFTPQLFSLSIVLRRCPHLLIIKFVIRKLLY